MFNTVITTPVLPIWNIIDSIPDRQEPLPSCALFRFPQEAVDRNLYA